ncbi:unnamed protein product [Mytilus edulis]|uniref:Uncharacterized protein n=1 Tax=Mytilus edulis TaxID=6550 RepID=A0A8S3QE58_MYTED|nr:unnamed protein product [Mytilus edulis]
MKGCIILSCTFILFSIFNLDVDAVCTGVPMELQGSTWEDSVTMKTFTFGTKTLKGFTFTYSGTTFKDFTCTGNTDNVYVFGSDNSHSSPTGSAEYFYLCMRIIKVTDNLFYYYLLAVNGSGTPVTADALCLPCTKTQAECDHSVYFSGLVGNCIDSCSGHSIINNSCHHNSTCIYTPQSFKNRGVITTSPRKTPVTAGRLSFIDELI